MVLGMTVDGDHNPNFTVTAEELTRGEGKDDYLLMRAEDDLSKEQVEEMDLQEGGKANTTGERA